MTETLARGLAQDGWNVKKISFPPAGGRLRDNEGHWGLGRVK